MDIFNSYYLLIIVIFRDKQDEALTSWNHPWLFAETERAQSPHSTASIRESSLAEGRTEEGMRYVRKGSPRCPGGGGFGAQASGKVIVCGWGKCRWWVLLHLGTKSPKQRCQREHLKHSSSLNAVTFPICHFHSQKNK